MAPKKQFSREQIIDKAFEIAKTEGMDSITIRKVADKLGSSIAPIYVNFKNVEDLKQIVIDKVYAIASSYAMTQYTGTPLLDIGIGNYKFAKEYSLLYMDLIIKNSEYLKKHNNGMDLAMEHMKGDPELKEFTDDELMEIIMKMSIFNAGLIIMTISGHFTDDFSEEDAMKLLERVVEDTIAITRIRKEGGLGR